MALEVVGSSPITRPRNYKQRFRPLFLFLSVAQLQAALMYSQDMVRSESLKRWQLYVLRLEDEKFYVGITSKTPEIRMQEHLNHIRGAYWTAMHRPLEIIHREDLGHVEKSQAEKRENSMVRMQMEQRGINNVRGGDLTSVDPYIRRFGYICDKQRWDALLAIIGLNLVIVYLLIDKYFLH